MEIADNIELVILRKPEVYIYKIPPRSPNGYKANAWNNSIWCGRMHILGSGKNCIIRFLEAARDELFAYCIVTEDIDASIEKALDSSRFFAIRLVDGQGRHAYVGLGFADRNDAFDFNCCLQDYLKRPTDVVTDNKLTPLSSTQNNDGLKKYQLKEDEQLTLSIKPSALKKTQKINKLKQESESAFVQTCAVPKLELSETDHPFKLEKKVRLHQVQQKQKKTIPQAANEEDLFDDKNFLN